jgi:DNA-binding NtrC family response regulator
MKKDRSRVRWSGARDIPISVRVLAATNRAPEKAIESKHLREDLYYRLNVFHTPLPPLRERTEDLPLLAASLIRDVNRKHGSRVTHLSPEVLERFQASSWPGNVRELRNMMERAAILAGEGEIQLHHLPGAAAPPPPPQIASQSPPEDALQVRAGSPMSEIEEAYLQLTLKHTKNNRRQASELLGICLRTLHSKLRVYESGKAASAVVGKDLN